MSQSFSSANKLESLVATDQLIIPLGNVLTDIDNRTLTPLNGTLAYGLDTNKLYYGNNAVWMDGMGATGAMGVTGTPGSTGSTGARGFTGATGVGTTDVTIGTFSNTPVVDGLTISGASQILNLNAASTGTNGGVNTTGQAFSGLKTFIRGIAIESMVPAIIPEYNLPTWGLFFARQTVGGDLGTLSISGDNFATSTTVAWSLQKLGRQIMLGWSSSINVTLAGNSSTIRTADGVIPVEFRPAAPRVTRCNVDQAGTISLGYVLVTISGQLFWGANITSDLPAIGPLIGANGAIVDDTVVFIN